MSNTFFWGFDKKRGIGLYLYDFIRDSAVLRVSIDFIQAEGKTADNLADEPDIKVHNHMSSPHFLMAAMPP
jgi:hypothetical protein